MMTGVLHLCQQMGCQILPVNTQVFCLMRVHSQAQFLRIHLLTHRKHQCYE